MSTTPVPSLLPEDFRISVADLDRVVNSGDLTYTNRLGVERRTLAGLSAEFPNAAANAITAAEQAAIATDAAEQAATAATDAAEQAAYQLAYVDFTTQPNGYPASILDSGQSVDYTFNASGRKPIIFDGRLVFDNQAGAGSGGAADYYQFNLINPIVRVGCEWTQPAGADDGNGNMTLAAWDGIYEGGGTLVPRSWVHLSIVPGTGATGTAKWFTCNGAGNLLNVKSQAFINPVADGVTVWRAEAVLDADAGEAFAWLPDGSIMKLTDAEISAFCIAVSKPVQSLKSLSSKVGMVEHYCGTGANAAKFAQFKNCYAETDSPAFKLRSDSPLNLARKAYALKLLVPPVPVGVVYAPTTALSVATTTSSANINTANGKFTATVGPSGILIVIASAYYEFTSADTVFWRIAGSTGASATRAAFIGLAGQKYTITQTIVFTGLTPGASVSGTLQHWSLIDGSATCKSGGSGSALFPPLTLVAIPA